MRSTSPAPRRTTRDPRFLRPGPRRPRRPGPQVPQQGARALGASRARVAVDARPARGRWAGRSPRSAGRTARSACPPVHQVEPVRLGEGQGNALPWISTSRVSGSARRTVASATQGDARRRALSASMSRPRMFSPTAGPSSSRTSPSERKCPPRTSTRPTLQSLAGHHLRVAAPTGAEARTRTPGDLQRQHGAPAASPAARGGRACGSWDAGRRGSSPPVRGSSSGGGRLSRRRRQDGASSPRPPQPDLQLQLHARLAGHALPHQVQDLQHVGGPGARPR